MILASMKKVVIAAATVLVLLVIAVLAANTPPDTGAGSKVIGVLETHDNPGLGFSVGYPKAWSVETEGRGVYFVSAKEDSLDTLRENANITVEDFADPMPTLKSYTASALQQVTALEHYKIITSFDRKIAGLPGHSITYSARIENHDLEFAQAWVLKGNKAYVMTLAAAPDTFEQHERIFGRMLKSLKLYESASR